MPTGTSYKGPCGLLKDSSWLTAEALPQGKDTVVTIEDVILHKDLALKNETKKVAGSLRFVGKDKELLLNATNMKTLSKLFGVNTANWFGKKIALTTVEISAFGSTMLAIRIRPKAPDGKDSE